MSKMEQEVVISDQIIYKDKDKDNKHVQSQAQPHVHIQSHVQGHIQDNKEVKFFFEDEVFRIKRRGQVVFGLVLDNCEPEDSQDEAPLRGHVRVLWQPQGHDKILPDTAIGLADRSLMPGDVVRRMIKGKDTQRGYCREIVMTAAVQVIGTNMVLPIVSSERLLPLEEFTSDLAVCLDSWVGTTKLVHSKLRLTSSDGSQLEVSDSVSCMLEDSVMRKRRAAMGRSLYHHEVTEFFPGQVLYGPLGLLDNVKWINTTHEMKNALKHKMRDYRFTVEAVETESVGVQWQCQALGRCNGQPQQPRCLVEGEDLKRLKLLNLFESCTLQVGARNYLIIQPDDAFVTKAQWKKNQGKIFRNIRRQTRPHKTREAKEKIEKESNLNHNQDGTNINDKHPIRLPVKPKKRHSVHYRESKAVGAQYNPIFPNAETKPAKDQVKSDTGQSKMDVDIVVNDEMVKLDGDLFDLDHNMIFDMPSTSPSKIDEYPKLDVPDPWKGRDPHFLSDQSLSPEVPETVERHKKLRKSRISTFNADRQHLPNGETRVCDSPKLDGGDSDWNVSSEEESDTDSCPTWSSHCSSTNSVGSGRGKKSPQLVTKFLKGKRLKRSSRKEPVVFNPEPGNKVVVETLFTTSKANVVWQDGTIELGIPSTELYPIHHLDTQECFPGDFVVSNSCNNDGPVSHRDYGVVQKVDHHGRTAVVKWFRTYTSCQEPVPEYMSENEMSVYDLKDHPDFQYRPGTVVIRVANFKGSESTCTAGQVIDNFPTGRVHVWWVDGHKSMCWPQDLYKIGDYDSEEDMWDDTASEDSWETQSSTGSDKMLFSLDKRFPSADGTTGGEDGLLSEAAPPTPGQDYPKTPQYLEPRAAVHIEKGRAAMARLEQMFSQNPALQNKEIMRRLLTLYKDCRFLDKLMGTSFFHEDHFQGLLERVRERGSHHEGNKELSGTRRVQYQVYRLFSQEDSDKESSPSPDMKKSLKDVNVMDVETVQQEPETSNDNICERMDRRLKVYSNEISKYSERLRGLQDSTESLEEKGCSPKSLNSDNHLKEPVDARFQSSSSEGSLEKSASGATKSSEDSAFCIQSNSSNVDDSISNNNYSDVPHATTEVTQPTQVSSSSSETQQSTRNVCLKLCSLINLQMTKACSEVNRRRSKAFIDFLQVAKIAPDDKFNYSMQYDSLVSMQDNKEATSSPAKIKKGEDSVGSCTASVLPENVVHESNTLIEAVPETPQNGRFLGEGFAVVETAPTVHRFRLSMLQPSEPRIFHQAFRREIKLLKSDLPPGVWVRSYEDRIDLFSVMIAGPEKTPYEDGLFLFDVQLGGEYPRAPPLCHYISYCTDRLNPNLYEDGKVCVSLLGTWTGRGSELWSRESSLLQVIVSIQGLILCSEPYYNEAGYDKQKGSQQGQENSRMYNEMVLLKLVQSMNKLLNNLPDTFRDEITSHQKTHGPLLCRRLYKWMIVSEDLNKKYANLTSVVALNLAEEIELMGTIQAPEYPLIPASKGFCLTLKSTLESYWNTLKRKNLLEADAEL